MQNDVQRVMPKVPGLNAQPLGPSIGTDHWRTRRSAPIRRNTQIRKARPMAGTVDHSLIPGKLRSRKVSAPMDDRPKRSPNTPKAPAHIRAKLAAL